MSYRMALLLACLSLPAWADGLQLEDARVIAVPPVSKNTAAYLTIRNTGPEADVLVGASSPAAATVELHDMDWSRGMVRMSRIHALKIRAGSELRMSPAAGKHLMLIGLQPGLAAGQEVPLTLTFRRAGEVTVQARVVALEEPETDHSHHH